MVKRVSAKRTAIITAKIVLTLIVLRFALRFLDYILT